MALLVNLKRDRSSCIGDNWFTLIELLVVIAIISILASMLLPVLSRAKYQAKLIACMNTHRQVVMGVTMYTGDFDDFYPDRGGADWDTYAGTDNRYPDVLKYDNGSLVYDDRSTTASYWSWNELLCPFHTDGFDCDNSSAARIYFSSELYYGWRTMRLNEETFSKVGDTMTYNGSEFDILSSSINAVSIDQTDVFSSHPDYGETSTLAKKYTDFQNKTTYQRGFVDCNYAREDGSAFTVKRVAMTDARLVRIPMKSNHGAITSRWRQLPDVDFSN